jgi:hypothetical protein
MKITKGDFKETGVTEDGTRILLNFFYDWTDNYKALVTEFFLKQNLDISKLKFTEGGQDLCDYDEHLDRRFEYNFEFHFNGHYFELSRQLIENINQNALLLKLICLSPEQLEKDAIKIAEELKIKEPRISSFSFLERSYVNSRDYYKEGDEDSCSGDYYWNIE